MASTGLNILSFFRKKKFNGFRNFLISFSAILFFFFSEQAILELFSFGNNDPVWANLKIPLITLFRSFNRFESGDMGNYRFIILFFVFVFFVLSVKKMVSFKFKKLSINFKFLIMNLILTVIFFLLDQFIVKNSGFVVYHWLFFNIFWNVVLLVWLFSLIFSFFDLAFIKHFLSHFYKQFTVSLITVVIISASFRFLRDGLEILGSIIWPALAKFTAGLVYFLLSLTFSDASFSIAPPNSGGDLLSFPLVGVGDFIVKIATGCSGVEGMSLFSILFMIIIFLEWKKINRVKATVLLLIGVLGCLFVNVVRIYSLLVVGALVNPEFAMGPFHANIGWVLFSIYFLTFEFFTYKWMLKK